MKQSKGYMVAPLDLSERQLLIYRALYSRCNFDTMLVDMTIDQIISGIKIIDLTYKVVYNEIKKLQQLGYIELVKKATKGNAPIYKIINYSEIIGKPKGNQRETKGKLKPSNFNGLVDVEGNQRETKGKPKGYTIKEKEKEKEIIDIYSLVITRLNELTSKNFKSKTKKTRSLIDARLKEGYVEEDFYKVIEIKCKEWLHDETMNIYLRPETLFGNKFESYLNQKEKKKIHNKSNGKVTQLKTRFHNINQSFEKYTAEELEQLLQENQKNKFNNSKTIEMIPKEVNPLKVDEVNNNVLNEEPKFTPHFMDHFENIN